MIIDKRAHVCILAALVFMEEIAHGKKNATVRWNGAQFGGRFGGPVVVGA